MKASYLALIRNHRQLSRVDMSISGARAMKNLSMIYHNALLAQPAENAAMRRAAFRLRYQVYCLERDFEDVSEFPEAMESDGYDAQARHLLVRTRGCGSILGASRLVVDGVSGAAGLPIESHCSRSVSKQLARVRNAHDTCIAEVSRLAVTRKLSTITQANGAGGASTLSSSPSLPRQHLDQDAVATLPAVRSQHVTMGLVALLFEQSWSHGVTHWAALLDPALQRFLRRVGIQFHPIGPVIDHRGPRQPVMATLEDLWSGVKAKGTALAGLVEQLCAPGLSAGQPRAAQYAASCVAH